MTAAIFPFLFFHLCNLCNLWISSLFQLSPFSSVRTGRSKHHAGREVPSVPLEHSQRSRHMTNEVDALALIGKAPQMIEFAPALVPAFVNIFWRTAAPFVCRNVRR